MPVIEERRITKSGASLIMTLPKEWTVEHNIKEGDFVLVKANGHIEIRVRNEENLTMMNKEVMHVRTELSHHITRLNDDQMGEKRQAQSSPMNNKSQG